MDEEMNKLLQTIEDLSRALDKLRALTEREIAAEEAVLAEQQKERQI